MMKNFSLLKWGQNNENSAKGGNKNWIHSPEALQRGHLVYLVKFLGCTDVDQPKGIEVVKEGIRKLKFNQQLKKAEGNKTPKVELTVSIDGVAVQEPKTKKIMHQYPLHRISYCADDKAEKKFFSFIAKESEEDKHTCFVFVSDKLAEEITLTIGQAFDLAYRRFLETSGHDLEMRKQMMILQKRVQILEGENGVLRKRLQEMAQLKDKESVEEHMKANNISDILIVNGEWKMENLNKEHNSVPETAKGNATEVALLKPPPVPPRAFEAKSKSYGDELISELVSLNHVPAVGTKLEGLLLDDMEDDFNPRAPENNNSTTGTSNGTIITSHPVLSPPPKPPRDSQHSSVNNNSLSPNAGTTNGEKDLFGADPFIPSPTAAETKQRAGSDPFGMGVFGESPTAQELESAIDILDRKISEMKDGFSQGLSFGGDNFLLESLDPLNKK